MLLIHNALFFMMGLLVLSLPVKADLKNTKSSQQVNLYSLELASLRGFSFVKTEIYRGQPSLWIAFKPDCDSCLEQLSSLSCLSKEIPVIALGLQGTQGDLAKTIKRINFPGASLNGSKSSTLKLKIAGTPTALLVDSDGKVFNSLLGVQSCETLRSAFSDLKLCKNCKRLE